MLTIVACGAPAASQIGELASLAIARGWTVAVASTPSGAAFVDHDEVQAITNHPVYATYRRPDEPRHRGLPETTAVIVAPATFNTVNKVAAGITDTYALGVVADAIGAGKPVVVVPYVNAELANRAPFRKAVEALRAEGVTVLLGAEHGRPPHAPGAGESQAPPWNAALDALESLTRR